MSGPHDLTGKTLDGRYRITKLLGEGGMGHVYEAIHLALGRKVAVKTLHPRLAYEATFRERFIREAKSASSIQHPNVVHILDFGDTPDGSVYFVMEHLEGRDLGSLLREQGKLPWARAREILVQAVRALGAAHAHDIVHRDIKPGNCFLTTSGASSGEELVKLLDFGIAKVGSEAEGGEGGPRLTGTGEVFGTASYMAPEQARGEPLDARSDIYSLGVMAYEMLTGQVPFTGVNAIHVITKHLSERPRPPRTLEPTIPPAVEALVLRAMAKEPKDRFASMGELEAALLAISAQGERGKTITRGSASAPAVRSKPAATRAPFGVSREAPKGAEQRGSRAPAVPPRAAAAPPRAAAPSPKAVPPPRARGGVEPGPAPASRPALPSVSPPMRSAAQDSSHPSGSLRGVPTPLPSAAHDPSHPSGSLRGVPTPLPSAAHDPSHPSGSLRGVPTPLPSAAYDSSYPSHPSIAVARPLSEHDVSGELGRGPASGRIAVGSAGESTRPPPGQLDHPTSPSISLRASSQTGRSARFTGPITADTSPHSLGRVPSRPLRRVAWVLGAIALVSVASVGGTLMVLRDGAEAPSTTAASTATALAPSPASPRAADEAAKEPAVPEPDPRPTEPSEPAPAPSEPSEPVERPTTLDQPAVPTSPVPSAVEMPEPSEDPSEPTDTSDIAVELDDEPEPSPEPSDDEPVVDASPTAAKRPMHLMQTCVDRRARAEAALAGRDWKGLLAATSVASCWPLAEQAIRRGMRVQAYADLGRFDACVAAGRGITNPQIRAAVKTCEEQRAR